MNYKKQFFIYNLNHLKKFHDFFVKVQQNILKNKKITKSFKITFELIKKEPSNKMRAYYWGVIVKMVKERLIDLGNIVDEEDAHKILKEETKFYTKKIIEGKNNTNILSEGKMFKKYKTISFEGEIAETLDYFEKCRIWSADILGIQIPTPNEKGLI